MDTINADLQIKNRERLSRYVERANNLGYYQRTIGFTEKEFDVLKAYADANGCTSFGEILSMMISDHREMNEYVPQDALASVNNRQGASRKMTSLYLSDTDFDFLRDISRSCGYRISAGTGASIVIAIIETSNIVG